jgi:hypothetical protein
MEFADVQKLNTESLSIIVSSVVTMMQSNWPHRSNKEFPIEACHKQSSEYDEMMFMATDINSY